MARLHTPAIAVRQGHQIGDGFVEAEVFALGGSVGWRPDLGSDDQMPDLMGDDVEIQRKGKAPTLEKIRAKLEKAETGLGVVVRRDERDLQSVQIFPEVPWNDAAKIALPDVEHEPYTAENVRPLEGPRARGEIVKMTLLIW